MTTNTNPLAWELASKVMHFAEEKYGWFSWDMVAETMSIGDIAQELETTRIRTERGAIEYIWKNVVRGYHYQRLEIEATAF